MKKTIIILSLIIIQIKTNAQIINQDYTLINDTLNKYPSIEKILELEKFKNKVVYIDIWFTTCSFCLQEFKCADSLKHKFKNDSVEFLYLCTRYSNSSDNENAKLWKEMILKYKLKGTHVLISDECYSEGFLKKYEKKYVGNIHYACPQYLLVDKHGVIVNFNPPRPSTGELLYSEIRNELDKK